MFNFRGERLKNISVESEMLETLKRLSPMVGKKNRSLIEYLREDEQRHHRVLRGFLISSRTRLTYRMNTTGAS
jgi:hypothetical protein